MWDSSKSKEKVTRLTALSQATTAVYQPRPHTRMEVPVTEPDTPSPETELAVVYRGRLEAVKEVAGALQSAGLGARIQNPGGVQGNA